MAMLFKDALAEEESILTLATVSTIDSRTLFTPNPDELIGQGFKSLWNSDNANAEVEITIDLKESKTLHSIVIVNRCDNPGA